MAKKTYDMLFKLLLLGDCDVGKTDLMFRFTYEESNTTFRSTIGIDFKIKTVELGGKKIKLQIWDTAGQERYHTITSSFYRGFNGIMLVYDITNLKSFESIPKWLQNIDEHTDKDVEKMIVGNKCHLGHLRQVPIASGEAMATKYNIPFLEVSAEANINVEKAFMTLTQAILNKFPDGKPQPTRVCVSQQEPSSKRGC